MNARQLYDELNKNGLTKNTGFAEFSLLEKTVRVTAKSAFGYVFQDWLEKWMESKSIKFNKNTNSQDWPDLFLEPSTDNPKGVVEVKTFDVNEGANFDIANFDAYCRSILTHSYRLDADYLIFCYSLNDAGDFRIKDMWLKKVWEISCPSEKLPLRCQVKQNVIVNIRPARWDSNASRFKPFSSRRDFVRAISDTLSVYDKRSKESKDWFERVAKNYKDQTGRDL